MLGMEDVVPLNPSGEKRELRAGWSYVLPSDTVLAELEHSVQNERRISKWQLSGSLVYSLFLRKSLSGLYGLRKD